MKSTRGGGLSSAFLWLQVFLFTAATLFAASAHAMEPEIVCTTDGSGDFILNLSGLAVVQPVKVAVLTPGVTERTGLRGSGLQTRLQGAVSGQTVSFQLARYEQGRDAVSTHTVTMPDCGCAQLRSSSTPKCWWLSGHSYTFAIQNLISGPVSYLTIAADTPSSATFNPNLIPVSPSLQYGQTRTFTITLANMAGASGTCFRIVLHDESFAVCGSIRVCVPLQRCWWSYDYDAAPPDESRSYFPPPR